MLTRLAGTTETEWDSDDGYQGDGRVSGTR
jgi:hypothetical protein